MNKHYTKVAVRRKIYEFDGNA